MHSIEPNEHDHADATRERSMENAVESPKSMIYWLYRPYFDLGPHAPSPPHHVIALEYGYRSIVEDRAYPRLQASLNPSFRTTLATQAGLGSYDVGDPRQIPSELRSERWQLLCEWVDNFEDLDRRTQVRVAWLLAKLCLFEVVERLLPESVLDNAAISPDDASLAYIRSWSRFRMRLDDPTRPYERSEFERIAAVAPPGVAQVDAYYQLVSQSSKYSGDVGATEHWQEKHLAAIERCADDVGDFQRTAFMTRYHRIGGFIPQMKRDAPGVLLEMELSEEYARMLPRPDDTHAVAADEMLYPVLESRIKEALWLKDLDSARARALEITELSPHDPRAWLHRGQVHVASGEIESALHAYRRAARFSPPGKEIARYMMAQCHEVLGDFESACDAYLDSLQVDPYAISSAKALELVAEKLGLAGVRAWAAERREELQTLKPVIKNPPVEPYRSFPPPAAAHA